MDDARDARTTPQQDRTRPRPLLVITTRNSLWEQHVAAARRQTKATWWHPTWQFWALVLLIVLLVLGFVSESGAEDRFQVVPQLLNGEQYGARKHAQDRTKMYLHELGWQSSDILGRPFVILIDDPRMIPYQDRAVAFTARDDWSCVIFHTSDSARDPLTVAHEACHCALDYDRLDRTSIGWTRDMTPERVARREQVAERCANWLTDTQELGDTRTLHQVVMDRRAQAVGPYQDRERPTFEQEMPRSGVQVHDRAQVQVKVKAPVPVLGPSTEFRFVRDAQGMVRAVMVPSGVQP